MVWAIINITAIAKNIIVYRTVTSIEIVYVLMILSNGQEIHVVAIIDRTICSGNILCRNTCSIGAAFVYLLNKEMTPLGIFVTKIWVCLEVFAYTLFLTIGQSIGNNPSAKFFIWVCPFICISIYSFTGCRIIFSAICTC